MKKIATIARTTPVVEEYSSSPRARSLGEHAWTMDLYMDSATLRGSIEWDIPGADQFADIGLQFERDPDTGTLTLTDYDGVFTLPAEACEMLLDAGFTVEDDFWPDAEYGADAEPVSKLARAAREKRINAILAVDASVAYVERSDRVREAAPALLEALRTLVREFDCGRTPLARDISTARALIKSLED